jgi:hypothetical protein
MKAAAMVMGIQSSISIGYHAPVMRPKAGKRRERRLFDFLYADDRA